MELKKALSLARALYIACFGLAGTGLLMQLVNDGVAKVLYAICLAVLVVYTVVEAAFVHCPHCGHVLRIRPLKKINICPQCGQALMDKK